MKAAFLNPPPLVFAHRGDSKHFPENTLEAFASAIEMNVDVIETDVHLSQDGEVVIWHDDTLERNTNGSGRIEDYTLKELQALDAGWSFTVDGGKSFPFRNQGVRMARLSEALEAFPTQRFNVDLKSKEDAIVEAFLEVVHTHNATDRLLCASFHLKHLQRVRRLEPKLLTSLTTLEIARLIALQRLGLIKRMRRPASLILQVPVRQWKIEVVQEDFVKAIQELGGQVQVWTVNDESEMIRLWNMGIDSIMTDNPRLALEVAQRLNLRTSSAQ